MGAEQGLHFNCSVSKARQKLFLNAWQTEDCLKAEDFLRTA